MRKLVDFPWYVALIGEMLLIALVVGAAWLTSKLDGVAIPAWGIYTLVLIGTLMWSRPTTKEINRAIEDKREPQRGKE